jgi:hypothetical protein
LDHLADDVFIVVIDLIGVGIFTWPESDETAGKLLFLETVSVANLVVDFFEAPQRRANFNDFHVRHEA